MSTSLDTDSHQDSNEILAENSGITPKIKLSDYTEKTLKKLEALGFHDIRENVTEQQNHSQLKEDHSPTGEVANKMIQDFFNKKIESGQQLTQEEFDGARLAGINNFRNAVLDGLEIVCMPHGWSNNLQFGTLRDVTFTAGEGSSTQFSHLSADTFENVNASIAIFSGAEIGKIINSEIGQCFLGVEIGEISNSTIENMTNDTTIQKISNSSVWGKVITDGDHKEETEWKDGKLDMENFPRKIA